MEDKVRQFLTSKFSQAILEEDNFRGQQSFFIKPDALIPICEALLDNDDLAVNLLADVCSVDWLNHPREKRGRFEVIYNLYSLAHAYRFFLRVHLSADDPKIESLVALWPGANWLEREVWDLMGIEFVGHPDLTKIVTPDELEGHPLRRDFPLTWEQPQFSWNKNEPPEVIK